MAARKIKSFTRFHFNVYARPFIRCLYFIYTRKNYAGVEFYPKAHGGLQSYEQTDALAPNIVGSCCVHAGSGVLTDATTPNNV